MISIILLKISLLNLRTVCMEFQVKLILYVIAKFLYFTMKCAYRHCWVPILCDTKKLGQLKWSKYVIDFLENGIRLRNAGDPASISGCMFNSHLLVRKYLHTITEKH
ncbi:hypothetical protein M9H77_28455 [Catharanthus roseus]|uniref:Uncharacterized protein n=1 Tax=Catharanthus roseus TaxID=4058 RepID=A0ACC0AGT3_CATRO|nr:hypothetical protein M9H77_28455 [Catharanthus roseus]